MYDNLEKHELDQETLFLTNGPNGQLIIGFALKSIDIGAKLTKRASWTSVSCNQKGSCVIT